MDISASISAIVSCKDVRDALSAVLVLRKASSLVRTLSTPRTVLACVLLQLAKSFLRACLQTAVATLVALDDLAVSMRQASTRASSWSAALETKHPRFLTLGISELSITSANRCCHAIGNALTALIARLVVDLLRQASTELVLVQIPISDRVGSRLDLADEALVIDLDRENFWMGSRVV